MGAERDGTPPLRRALGQHHLRSPASCRPLVALLERHPGEVLEIGPGGGVLTGELLRLGRRVHAVELDRAWAFRLRERCSDAALGVAVADALELAWRRLDPRVSSVVGNLPYNIATAVLERLLDQLSAGRLLAFLVQREVADRIVAVPGTKQYGALSVLVQARGRPRLLGRVAAGAFRPPPKVESAFFALHLEGWSKGEVVWPFFKRVVRDAFGHRRKTLLNSLRLAWGEPARAVLEEVAIDGSMRPERLDVAGYLRLAGGAARLGIEHR